MEHFIDVLAHTWKGWPLIGLACVGGLALASSFACVALMATRKINWEARERARYQAIVLAFDPASRGLYAFRPEQHDGVAVPPPQEQKESVH